MSLTSYRTAPPRANCNFRFRRVVEHPKTRRSILQSAVVCKWVRFLMFFGALRPRQRQRALTRRRQPVGASGSANCFADGGAELGPKMMNIGGKKELGLRSIDLEDGQGNGSGPRSSSHNSSTRTVRLRGGRGRRWWLCRCGRTAASAMRARETPVFHDPKPIAADNVRSKRLTGRMHVSIKASFA
jgi:hypothetical protein